ncbi:MAG TPA: hypothetical protein VFJ71_04535 [Candidatus Limnocylindrales bacterium]|nr:hypothetical protein [Candidatus Limnocylindrales bacterium]
MPTWRCPHCATPQEESSRCWVCHRSSTSCGTCRHFRGSVAARLGFCGLDRRRQPLGGDEVRACWEDGAIALPPEPPVPGLLDLLTVHALGDAAVVPSDPEADAATPAHDRPHRPVPRLRSGSPSRDWVEVDLQPVEA